MITKHYKGRKYFIVPALEPGMCEGCFFQHTDDAPCPHNNEASPHHGCCWDDDGDNQDDPVWIPATKKALAEYITLRMEGYDADQD